MDGLSGYGKARQIAGLCLVAFSLWVTPHAASAETPTRDDVLGTSVEIPDPEGFARVASGTPEFDAAQQALGAEAHLVALFAPTDGSTDISLQVVSQIEVDGVLFYSGAYAALREKMERALRAHRRDGGPAMPRYGYDDYQVRRLAGDDPRHLAWIGLGRRAEGGARDAYGGALVDVNGTFLWLYLRQRGPVTESALERALEALERWARGIEEANPPDERTSGGAAVGIRPRRPGDDANDDHAGPATTGPGPRVPSTYHGHGRGSGFGKALGGLVLAVLGAIRRGIVRLWRGLLGRDG